MSFLLFAVLLLLLVSLAVFVRAVAHAPEGYEDASGFHFSEETHAAERIRSEPVPAHAFSKASMPKHA